MINNNTSYYKEETQMEEMGRVVTKKKDAKHITFNSMKIWMTMMRMGLIKRVTMAKT